MGIFRRNHRHRQHSPAREAAGEITGDLVAEAVAPTVFRVVFGGLRALVSGIAHILG